MGGGHSPRLVPSHFLEQYITPKNMIINFGVFFNVADVRIEHLKLCMSFFKSKQLYDQEHWILALKYRKFKSGTDSGCVHKNGTSANTFLPPTIWMAACTDAISLLFLSGLCVETSHVYVKSELLCLAYQLGLLPCKRTPMAPSPLILFYSSPWFVHRQQNGHDVGQWKENSSSSTDVL